MTVTAQPRMRVLFIFMEPTPYIQGLLVRLRAAWPGPIAVWYLGRDVSQPWTLPLGQPDTTFLPEGRWSAIGWIWRHLRADHYGLVHLAAWGHPLMLFALCLARWQGLPTAMESDTPLPPGPLPWRIRLKRALHPLLFKLPSVFLPAGQRQARYLMHYGIPATRIRIAQMTVDVTRIARHAASLTEPARTAIRHRLGICPNTVLVLYVGRLEPVKGIDDLIAAFTTLRQSRPAMELLLVGDGSLRSLINTHSAGCLGVHAAGRLQGEPLLDAYAVADIFVLPSHFEPWGLVVNEAMAAGLPVIVTDRVGCIDDLVEPEKTGLVIPAGDRRALAEAMARLAADSRLRRAMAAEARRRIQPWTLDNEAARIIGAWREFMSA